MPSIVSEIRVSASNLPKVLNKNEMLKLDHKLHYVVAFSGGPDSALLAYLMKQEGYQVRLIHCVHPDSKASSDGEEIKNFCIIWAKHYEMELECVNLEIDDKRTKIKGIEAAERESRYTTIFSHMRQDEVLATGHHLDDSIENLFIRLLRGTSIHGLRGIGDFSYLNFSPAQAHVRVVRPLKKYKKSEVLNSAVAVHLLYGHEKLNDAHVLTRGFIRNIIVPALKLHFSENKFYSSLSRFIKSAGETSELLKDLYHIDYQTLISNETGITRKNLINLPDRRQRNFLHFYVDETLGVSLTEKQTNEILKRAHSWKLFSKHLTERFTINCLMITITNEFVIISKLCEDHIK
jgi:tRNA(Ile)-lysidine synthase